LILGLALGLLVQGPGRAAALLLAAAVAFILWPYLSAPTDDPPTGRSDCGEFLGRWWEPGVVGFILILNLLACGVGAFLGRALRTRTL
jgi:hypothetical protein